jgi:hypothetical protein
MSRHSRRATSTDVVLVRIEQLEFGRDLVVAS